MALINRSPVSTRSSGGIVARVLAVSAGLICMTHLAGPLWGQTWSCVSGVCTTNWNVGVGTGSPVSLLEVRSPNSTAPSVSIGLTTSSFPIQTVGSLAFGSLYSPNGAWYQAAGVNGVNEASGDSSFGALTFSTRNSQILAEKMRITSSGNVGIGTTAPGAKLEVNGGGTDNGVRLYSGGSSNFIYLALGRTGADALIAMAGASGEFSPAAVAGDLVIRSEGKNIMFSTDASGTTNQVYFKNGGNVGIGTTAPQSKLAVNGTITTREVIVTNTGWSDYVFKPNYHLPQLREVAAYIKAHHHLPEIPSEAEVEEKGFKVGEIQVKLLAKVEELTLHAIQADERNNRLEQQNRDLQQRLAGLEARLAGGEPKTERKGR